MAKQVAQLLMEQGVPAVVIASAGRESHRPGQSVITFSRHGCHYAGNEKRAVYCFSTAAKCSYERLSGDIDGIWSQESLCAPWEVDGRQGQEVCVGRVWPGVVAEQELHLQQCPTR